MVNNQLIEIKNFISKDSKSRAVKYLLEIKNQIEILADFPYIGKVNTTKSNKSIRDFVVYGYKIIYKINSNNILILAIYKYNNFDEKVLKV